MNEAISSQNRPPVFVQFPNLQNQPRPALHARRSEMNVDGMVPDVSRFNASITGERAYRSVLSLTCSVSLKKGPGFAPFQMPLKLDEYDDDVDFEG
mmetsp:Transcript_22188/g.45545  ORF Transcript_22188/g.45545 Transcript_22188/m.45545 type:complete len:96 (+) Transcript_22188:83-370(+)